MFELAILCLLVFVFAIWGSVLLALLVFAAVAVWMVVGLVWAPFAGWLLVRKSYDYSSLPSSDRKRRFAIGAASSALFLVPWVYLMLYYGRKHTIRAVWVPRTYKALFVVWTAGAFQQAVILGLGGFVLLFLNPDPDTERLAFGGIILLALLPLHGWSYVMSIRRLRRQWREDVERATSGAADSAVVDFCRTAYIRPFVLTYLWTVAGAIHYWIFAISGWCHIEFMAAILPVCA